jgi:hypothetical protein
VQLDRLADELHRLVPRLADSHAAWQIRHVGAVRAITLLRPPLAAPWNSPCTERAPEVLS